MIFSKPFCKLGLQARSYNPGDISRGAIGKALNAPCSRYRVYTTYDRYKDSQLNMPMRC